MRGQTDAEDTGLPFGIQSPVSDVAREEQMGKAEDVGRSPTAAKLRVLSTVTPSFLSCRISKW